MPNQVGEIRRVVSERQRRSCAGTQQVKPQTVNSFGVTGLLLRFRTDDHSEPRTYWNS